MESRGELSTLGEATVPVAPWLAQVMQHVEGQTIAAPCLDRYKQAEIGEGIDKAGIRAPLVCPGMGFRPGGEASEPFPSACPQRRYLSAPPLPPRSPFPTSLTPHAPPTPHTLPNTPPQRQ